MPATRTTVVRNLGIPCRVSLAVLLWLCNICLFLARACMSVAVLAMYGSDEIDGALLSAFYWGYTVPTHSLWKPQFFRSRTCYEVACRFLWKNQQRRVKFDRLTSH